MMATSVVSSEPVYRPVSLAGMFWLDAGRVASFGSARPGYGVQVVASGAVLTRDGVCPAVWRTRSAAQLVADFAGGMTQYVQMWVFDSAEAARRVRS